MRCRPPRHSRVAAGSSELPENLMPATLKITYGIPQTLGAFGGTLPVLTGDSIRYEEITVGATSVQGSITAVAGEVARLDVSGDNTRIAIGTNPVALNNAGAKIGDTDEPLDVCLREGQKIAAILSA